MGFLESSRSAVSVLDFAAAAATANDDDGVDEDGDAELTNVSAGDCDSGRLLLTRVVELDVSICVRPLDALTRCS